MRCTCRLSVWVEKLHFPNVTVLTQSRIFSRLVAENLKEFPFHRLFCSESFCAFQSADYPTFCGLCSSLEGDYADFFPQQYTKEKWEKGKCEFPHISCAQHFPVRNWISLGAFFWEACGCCRATRTTLGTIEFFILTINSKTSHCAMW